MRFALRACTVALTSLLVLPVAGSAVTNTKNPPAFQTSQLDNGLSVVTVETHKVPLITIVLTARAGAMTESPETNGLTHLWEHMFFKGNKRIPNQEAFQQRIQELGIVYNGDTSAEVVRYYFTLPSAFLDEGLQFMADAIRTPLIDQEELVKERQVVINEYDRNASQPQFNAFRLENKIIYGDQDYLRDPLGKRKIIDKASREQLLQIRDQVFVPKNMALLVAGDFTPDSLQGLVKKYFGTWENPKDWKPVTPTKFGTFPKTQELVTTHKDASNVLMQYTFAGPRAALQPKDSFAVDVLISLLQQRSGKFYKKYIDSGLALAAGLSYHTQSQAGELGIFAQATADNAKKVRTMLGQEAKEWAKKGYFSQQQLEDVRRSLAVSHQFELNKTTEFVKSLGFWWAVTGLDYYAHYLENLQKITLEDIQKFAQTYFVNQHYVETDFMTPEDAKKIGMKDNTAALITKYFPE